MRGDYDRASEYLRQAGEAYGAQGPQAARWYEWSVKVLEVKIATRRGDYEEAVALADELSRAADIPPTDAIQADLAACEALLAAGRPEEARTRLSAIETRFDPRSAPANWGEFLRVRGTVHASLDEPATAYHDFAQSATVFDLLGERYQTAASHLALAKLAARAGATRAALRSLDLAGPLFSSLGAEADAADVRKVRATVNGSGATGAEPFMHDAEDAVVRRLVDASLLPELLAREIRGRGRRAARRGGRRGRGAARQRRPASGRNGRPGCRPRRHRGSGPGGRWCPGRRRSSGDRGLGCRSRWPAHGGSGVSHRPQCPDQLAAQDDRGRRAPGLRSVRGPRAPGPGRRPVRAIGPSSCCSRGSSAPAPRCRASRTRFSGSRATRSRC